MVHLARRKFERRGSIGIFKTGIIVQDLGATRPASKHFEDIGHADTHTAYAGPTPTRGQQSPTLSGGEAQRIMLVAELAKARPAPEGGARRLPLYVLDEPTVGLHMADLERLIRVLHRLVDAGHSVLVIEHDLDLIAAADRVLELEPEGGDGGGRLVAEGTPAELARVEGSHTAVALRRRLVH